MAKMKDLAGELPRILGIWDKTLRSPSPENYDLLLEEMYNFLQPFCKSLPKDKEEFKLFMREWS